MNLQTMKWSLAKGSHDGSPLLIRFRQFPDDFPRAAYPDRLNVFWEMADADKSGMPSSVETARMEVFENRLVEAVEADQRAVLSVVLTCQGKREFVFHTDDAKDFLRRLTEMDQEREPYPIEIHRRNDPKWAYDDSVIPN